MLLPQTPPHLDRRRGERYEALDAQPTNPAKGTSPRTSTAHSPNPLSSHPLLDRVGEGIGLLPGEGAREVAHDFAGSAFIAANGARSSSLHRRNSSRSVRTSVNASPPTVRTWSPSTPSVTGPDVRTVSWNPEMSKRLPNRCSASARSQLISNCPIL